MHTRITSHVQINVVEKPNMASRRDAIMIRLLDRCIRVLSEQGMKKMFIDAIKGGDDGFQSMG